MNNVQYLLLLILFIFACSPEDIDPPTYPSEYGKGMYILTEQGVTYYDYNSPDTARIVKENIFQNVNSKSISNPSSLKIINEDIYIVSQHTLYRANINTFLQEIEITGFIDAQKCEYAKFNRLYVSDIGESEIKVVDLDVLDITSHIKTGVEVNPTDIAVNWGRAFIINSGAEDITDYDSTMVAIDVKDGVVAINEFAGNIILDKNPTSVIDDGAIIVLCKGIYDVNNSANNTESSINRVGAGNLNVINVIVLGGIYNAGNLIFNYNKTRYYITSESGVYWLDPSSYVSHLVTSTKIPSILSTNVEQYADTDTTFAYSEMIYMNDNNTSSEFIYKYNIQLNQFVDSFPVNSKVLDIQIYK